VYKFEETALFNGLADNVAAHFSLRAEQSADIAFIDMLTMDTAPIIADRDKHQMELIKINSEQGFNRTADYLIFKPELNAIHIISRDNAGHLSIDGKAVGGGFIAEHSGLLQNWGDALTEKACGTHHPAANYGVHLINSLASFINAGSKYFSFSACCFDTGLPSGMIWDYAAAEGVVITVNGMMNKASSIKLDTINATRRFYVDIETSVTRVNENLLHGHAGTGNDGWVASTSFSAFNNAIDGTVSLDGVVIYSKNTISLNPAFHPYSGEINNKFRFYKNIIARCTNVST
jgi:hypothetical protein